MVAEPILTKRQCYRLWTAGELGNKLRSWPLAEWKEGIFDGRVALRTNRGSGGPCSYDLEPGEVSGVAEKWRAWGGYCDSDLVVCEMADWSRTVLQGEYFNGVLLDGSWGHFFHSRAALPMRAALAPGQVGRSVRTGLAASLILRGAMTPSSWEDWQLLLDRYPDHVLEVSVYDCCLGDVPGRNALVWEVRRY